jgi:signal peptidase I
MNSSMIEPFQNSARVKALGFTGCFFYRGPSMSPTFQVGDLLYINAAPANLAPGDVIVFHGSPEEGIVVHRITSIQAGGMRTRGDNNRLPDADLQLPEDTIGRVEAAEYDGQFRRVRGGQGGLWSARTRWMIGALRRSMRGLFIGPYRLLRKSRVVHRIWKPAIIQLRLENQQGNLIKYIYKHKTVATWEPEWGRFKCRKPFDLVLFSPGVDK